MTLLEELKELVDDLALRPWLWNDEEIITEIQSFIDKNRPPKGEA